MVSDEPMPYVGYDFPGTSQFAQHVAYLADRFGFIDYPELKRRREQDLVLDNRACITFDDGYAQCFEKARPVLLEHKAPGIFFLVTELIDNRVMFREDIAFLCTARMSAMPHAELLDFARSMGVPQDPVAPVDEVRRAMIAWLVRSKADRSILDRLCGVFGIDQSLHLRSRPTCPPTRSAR